MSDILGSVFLGAVKDFAKKKVVSQLAIIKANNSKEFYEQLLQSLDHSFALLEQATKNKVVLTAAKIFTEPIEEAAAADNIPL